MSGRFERPSAATTVANGAVTGSVPPAAPVPPTGDDAGAAELRARRDALARELAERQWDLGGLTYEMAIRDHFRLDVLVRKAAEVQEVDAELGEVERILALHEHAASGMCGACGAPHSRGAVFCWQCGSQLMPTSAPPA